MTPEKKPTPDGPARTPGKLFTIPNLLSLFRLLSAPFVFLFFSFSFPAGRWLTLAFLALSFSTDFFDGFFARRLKQQSDLGRMLDPLADKAVVLALLIAVVAFRGVPLYFVLIVLVRDLLILCGGLFVKLKKGVVLESNLWGKAATFILMVAFLVFIFPELALLGYALLAVGMLFVIQSFATYLILFLKTIRTTGPANRR
jgi:cardiolipin synthase